MSKKIKPDGAWARLVEKTESSFSPKGKLLIGSLLIGLVGMLGYSTFMGTTSRTSSTVMITNMAESSGGSGVIFESTTTHSTILTNAHICRVVKGGGVVITSLHEKYLVDSYVVSPDHDACLITVKSDLGIDTALADEAPSEYDSASISGHPALLPNVISKGHFAQRKVIYLLHSVRKCTQEDRKNPNLAMMCMFFGKLPIFKAYESIVVTATIMGGSSGSAVYNWRHQISGLAFAGNGKGLSFAYIVPYEYVASFVQETKTGDTKLSKAKYKPEYTIDIKDLTSVEQSEDAFTSDVRNIISKCSFVTEKDKLEIRKACSYMENSTLWLKD